MTDPMTPEELEAFAADAPECEHSPLWVLLDWSLWAAGMGDTFRAPLASTMVAAVPSEARVHAELIMAEWLKLRGVDSPSRTNAELRAENARLNAALAARDRTVEALSARLTAKNAELDKVIREAAADKAKLDAVRKIKPQRRNSAMVTSEQLATMHGWNDAVNAIREALEPCECGMTDPSTWTTYGGATEPGSVYEWNPDCPAHGDDPAAAPEMPRPPAEEGPTEEQRAELIVGLLFGEPGTANESAQEPVSGPETAGTGSGRGTGVAETPGTAQAGDAWREFSRVIDEEEPDDILAAALDIPGLWADENQPEAPAEAEHVTAVRGAYRPEHASVLLRLIADAETTTPYYRRPVIVQDGAITDAGFLRDAVAAVWGAVPHLLPSLPVPGEEA